VRPSHPLSTRRQQSPTPTRLCLHCHLVDRTPASHTPGSTTRPPPPRPLSHILTRSRLSTHHACSHHAPCTHTHTHTHALPLDATHTHTETSPHGTRDSHHTALGPTLGQSRRHPRSTRAPQPSEREIRWMPARGFGAAHLVAKGGKGALCIQGLSPSSGGAGHKPRSDEGGSSAASPLGKEEAEGYMSHKNTPQPHHTCHAIASLPLSAGRARGD
jgi:hypothetical protein